MSHPLAEQTIALDEKILSQARDEELKGNFLEAFKLADSIPTQSDVFVPALRFQLELFLKRFKSGDKQSPTILLNVLSRVAANPEILTARSAIEHFFGQRVEEPFAAAILGSVISAVGLQYFHQVIDRISRGEALQRDLSSLREDVDEEMITKFLEIVTESFKGAVVVGSGTLSAEAKALLKPSFVNAILTCLESNDSVQGLDVADLLIGKRVMLHILVSVCKEFHEPVSDMLGLHWLIQYTALRGRQQEARDFAETGLLYIRNTQPKFLNDRTAQAWFCYAEAFHRSHNPLHAALFFALGLKLHGTDMPNFEWGLRQLKLAVRISRDLGQAALAQQFMTLTRKFAFTVLKKPAASFVHHLDTLEISVELALARNSVEKLQDLLKKTSTLLRLEIKQEEQALVSAAANAVRLLHLFGDKVAQETLTEIKKRVSALPDPQRAFFQGIIDPSQQHDLREMLREIGDVKYRADLNNAVLPLLPVCFTLLPKFCDTADAEAFFIASNVLCQPTLNPCVEKQTAGTANDEKWRDLLASGERDVTRLSQAYLETNFTQTGKYSISVLADLNIASLQSVLGPGESVEILLSDDHNQMYRLSVTTTDMSAPKRLNAQAWNSEAYSEWRGKYPKRYAEWLPPDPLEGETVTAEEVRSSLMGLSLGDIQASDSLIVIPSPSLFGFPFNMLQNTDGELLLGDRRMSVAPSATWLVRARHNAWTGQLSAKAWFGGKDTQDFTLQYLRAKLSDPLKHSGFEIVETAMPEGMLECQLGIVASHGGTGVAGYFRSVGDHALEISPETFATYFCGAGCVVLFVCSAAVAHQQHMTAEALGLVSAFLRQNVRCVVACPWPLLTDIVLLWTEPFVTALRAGKTVEEAAFEAAHKIKAKFGNPCAWAAFHVYGDGQFKLTQK